MKIESAKLRYRPVTMDDQTVLKAVLADWTHDNILKGRTARFDDNRIHNTLNKWVMDMEVEPYDVPLTASSLFRQTLALYLDSTSSVESPPENETVLGVIVLVARGKVVTFEAGAIHPTYRRGGLFTELYTTMTQYGFLTLQADCGTWEIPQSSVAPLAIQNRRLSEFSDYVTKTGEIDGRIETKHVYTLTKAQFEARRAHASGADEKALRYVYTA